MRKYRFDYRLQIEHSTGGSSRHRHTLEISFTISIADERQEKFSEIEKTFENCLTGYQNQYLNDKKEFGGNTTIENIGEVLCEKLNQIAIMHGADLYHFEIGETPLRMYLITDEP